MRCRRRCATSATRIRSVALHLHQGSPHQIAQMLIDGEADVGIATEALAHYDELVALPCYRWTHCGGGAAGPRAGRVGVARRALTLQQLARHPIITYESGYTGRAHIDQAFAKAGLGTRRGAARRWTPT